MTISHCNQDHRETVVRRVELYIEDPDTHERRIMWVYSPNPFVAVPPHWTLGFDVDYEPTEQAMRIQAASGEQEPERTKAG